jgi:hypothetical protein
VVLGALRDTETALNTYVHDLQREDSTRKARDEAERAVRDSQRLQAEGGATSLAVIDSQETYAASEQTLAQLETALSRGSGCGVSRARRRLERRGTAGDVTARNFGALSLRAVHVVRVLALQLRDGRPVLNCRIRLAVPAHPACASAARRSRAPQSSRDCIICRVFTRRHSSSLMMRSAGSSRVI